MGILNQKKIYGKEGIRKDAHFSLFPLVRWLRIRLGWLVGRQTTCRHVPRATRTTRAFEEIDTQRRRIAVL